MPLPRVAARVHARYNPDPVTDEESCQPATLATPTCEDSVSTASSTESGRGGCSKALRPVPWILLAACVATALGVGLRALFGPPQPSDPDKWDSSKRSAALSIGNAAVVGESQQGDVVG